MNFLFSWLLPCVLLLFVEVIASCSRRSIKNTQEHSQERHKSCILSCVLLLSKAIAGLVLKIKKIWENFPRIRPIIFTFRLIPKTEIFLDPTTIIKRILCNYTITPDYSSNR